MLSLAPRRASERRRHLPPVLLQCLPVCLQRQGRGLAGARQSALRFSRLREEADLAFLRRVSERATALLSGAKGLVLAGKADAKKRLLPELSQQLASRVLCSIALPCDASAEALRLAASRAADAVDGDMARGREVPLEEFATRMEAPDESGTTICYGKHQTQVALELGAVETLLLAHDQGEQKLREIAEAHGAVTVEVHNSSAGGAKFCSAFKIGALLRWPVDPELLEGDSQPEDSSLDAASVPLSQKPGQQAPTSATSSVAASSASFPEPHDMPETCSGAVVSTDDGAVGQRADAYAWLEAEVSASQGKLTAEAVVACVQIILEDETTEDWEKNAQAEAVLRDEGVDDATIATFMVSAQ
eukprot:TRINITY_DN124973_c0_g1_i1.p1 TRINITY_DN124973_c0_g1~~TRINITY_DN124973_c0_g1_i1.p1  ORF type:complete len:360 (-),score=76.46 TRINITY_DN124973_c0_g1_i1:234-1313(-)